MSKADGIRAAIECVEETEVDWADCAVSYQTAVLTRLQTLLTQEEQTVRKPERQEHAYWCRCRSCE